MGSNSSSSPPSAASASIAQAASSSSSAQAEKEAPNASPAQAQNLGCSASPTGSQQLVSSAAAAQPEVTSSSSVDHAGEHVSAAHVAEQHATPKASSDNVQQSPSTAHLPSAQQPESREPSVLANHADITIPPAERHEDPGSPSAPAHKPVPSRSANHTPRATPPASTSGLSPALAPRHAHQSPTPPNRTIQAPRHPYDGPEHGSAQQASPEQIQAQQSSNPVEFVCDPPKAGPFERVIQFLSNLRYLKVRRRQNLPLETIRKSNSFLMDKHLGCLSRVQLRIPPERIPLEEPHQAFLDTRNTVRVGYPS